MKTLASILIVLLVLAQLGVNAQDLTLITSSEYLRDENNSVLITTEVLDEEEEEPVEGISLKLFHLSGADTIQLKDGVSDEKGMVSYQGIDYSSLKHDESGYFHFILKTDQTDQFAPYTGDYKVRDLLLELNLEIIDSVNTMGIRVQSWEEGELVGIEDEEVILYAQRLFSKLKIAETWTSKTGEDNAEFPMDLPGGINGEVKIIAGLEDHSDFGTVFVSGTVNWGIPLPTEAQEKERELWSMDAPVWMIVTFWVLMTGVWGHYFWMIWNLRSLNKKQTTQDSQILFMD